MEVSSRSPPELAGDRLDKRVEKKINEKTLLESLKKELSIIKLIFLR